MRKILAVVRREFIERVRQKWFWVIVLLGPLFFGAIFVLPTLLASGGGVKRIVVVDGTSAHLGPRVADLLNQSLPNQNRVFVATSIPAGGRAADTLTLTDEVGAKRLDGFLVLTDALVDSGKAEYRASNVSAFNALGVLQGALRGVRLLLGRILGVGAVSLFQFLLWGLSARVLYAQRSHLLGRRSLGDAGQVFQIPHVTPATGIVFGAYFLGGFFLYSAMFAAVGAMSSNEQEARQAQQPVTMLLVVSFLSMFAMLNDPGSTLAVTLSMIPFSAPIAMPVRWAAGNLPASEVALSLGILVVSILAVAWIAARIYRVGILMTGKRPSLKEIIRWVRAG